MRTLARFLVIFFAIIAIHTLQAQCDFTISPSAPNANCQYALEEVVWIAATNLNISGNNITKNAGGNNNFNAGAISTATLGSYGYIQTTVNETNRDRAFGLSNTDGGVDLNSIDYAIQLRSNGQLRLFENGTTVENPGAYSSGDVLRIEIDNNVVKYYRNNTLLRISNTVPILPLIADVSIDDLGGTIQNVIIANGTDGIFSATESNPGTGASYEWFLNGISANTGTSYTNTGLVDGDVVTAVLTTGAGGCAVGTVNSNEITIIDQSPSQYSDFYIQGSTASSACYEAREEVIFTDIVNLNAAGNDLTKLQGGNNNFNAGAISLNSVANNGYAETTVVETNRDRVFGLSNTNGGSGLTNIQYAVQLRSNGTIRIFESGATVENPGGYTTGDVIRIAVEDNVVKYYRNTTLLRSSNTTPTLPLLVDVSFDDEGGTLNDIIVSNGNTGVFNAVTTNAGSNPTYQWTLNGGNVGTNSPSYSNTMLNDGDLIRCVIIPDLDNCSMVSATTTEIEVRELSTPDFGDFYIANAPASSACKEAIEQVVFTDVVNLNAAGNDLTKLQGGNNNFNAGAISLNSVANNGYAETTVVETNRDRAFGLSTTNGGNDLATIQYAVQLRSNGTIRIFESGVTVENPGGYASGDVIRIAVEDNMVKYYRNTTLLRSSNTTPTLPLLVDVSFDDEGGTLNDIIVSNGNTGVFNAVTTNAGSNPTYQWTLNGGNVGTNSSSYSNTMLNNGDIVTVEITPDLAGCSNVTYTANTVTINDLPTPEFGDFYVANAPASSACKEAIEQAVFTDVVNLNAAGNDLTKLQGGNNNFNAGAISLNSVANNGYAETTVAETNRDRAFGLSTTNGGNGLTNIQYAVQLRSNGTIRIFESGVTVENPGNYANGDVIRIAVENNVVKYYRNTTLLRSSNTTPTLPLRVDVSFDDEGGTLNDIIVSNGNTGVFNAVTTNTGSNPTYQWKLNGGNVGTNSSSYSNTMLNNGDIVTVEITPDLGGCSNVTYTANTVTINDLPTPDFGDFYIANAPASSACKEAIEQVVFTDVVNLNAAGNDLTKLQGGNNNFNAGAISLNSVANNGYAETTVVETNRDRVFGLSTTNGGNGLASIQYAVQLRSNGTIRIFESGVTVENPGSYANGDVIRIAVENNMVKYYRNTTLLRISSTAPSLPLLVDVSFDDEGGTLNDIIVSNGNTGVFNAVTTNAGSNPTYQWKLNGGNVGTNSSSYSNTMLNNGDIVTVEITPDLGGCSNVTYTANTVTINDIPTPSFGTFYIANTPVSGSAPVAFEQITWTDVLNLEQSGNSVSKLQGGNGNYNAGAASLNTVVNNSLLQTVVTQTNRDRTIGLSNSNTGVDRNSIQFGIELRSDSRLRIYESGVIRSNSGAYAIGDTIKIAVRSNMVEYYRNATLLYTSAVTPTLPLIADVSIEDEAGVLSDVSIVSFTDGDFLATVSDAGTNPAYQWKLNGFDVGSNQPTYSNTSLNDQDIITLEITPDIGGCATIVNPYTSNEILIELSNSVLPVVLTYFIAEVTEKGVDLKWETASEINNDYYIIEASKDNTNFQEIARIEGAGNSQTTKAYHYVDNNILSGRYYYRLTQVDFDGTSEKLGIASVFRDSNLSIPISIFPNPSFNGHVTIKGNLPLYDRLQILNANGLVVYDKEGLTEYEHSISTQKLPRGIYFIKLTGQPGVEMLRFSKIN